MNSAAALVLTVSLVGLAGCGEVRDLPPIATADRVEMGALLVIRARFEADLAIAIARAAQGSAVVATRCGPIEVQHRQAMASRCWSSTAAVAATIRQ
jgi:hypothetical protein